MARVQLNLPEIFPYSTEIAVRISEINYGGHLGNDSALTLLQEARIRFLQQAGYTELNIEGLGLVISDAAIIYKSEAFHGDLLKVDIAARDMTAYGCDFVYRVSQSVSGKEVIRAKTGIVFIRRDTRRVARIPEGFKAFFFPPGTRP